VARAEVGAEEGLEGLAHGLDVLTVLAHDDPDSMVVQDAEETSIVPSRRTPR
jgi:hypothetical protein